MELRVLTSDQVDAATRMRLAGLWERAFGDSFDQDDADHAFGGIHVIATDRGEMVGHGSVVPREIRFGGRPWRTIGYVEAVATDPTRQREGVGRRVMTALADEIGSRWPVAMLSTGRATGFYESLGWEGWKGLSFTQTAGERVPDDGHGGLMILRIDPDAVPDLTVDVTCQDRSGDAW